MRISEALRAAAESLAAASDTTRLDAEVKDLRQGLFAVEERARYELGMVRPDEVFIQVNEGQAQRLVPADPLERNSFLCELFERERVGRLDEAKAEIETVLKLDPEDPDAHYQLGTLLAERDPAGAMRHLKKTLTKVPHHQSACYRLANLLRKSGDAEGAREFHRILKMM